MWGIGIVKSKYKTDCISFKKLQENVQLPSYQRNVVWTMEKRKNFINTVLAGNPFGSILLYKDGDSYLLVDGLQRYSTLRDFMSNPSSYIDISENSMYYVDKIIEVLSETDLVTNYSILRKSFIEKIEDTYSLDKDITTLSEILIDFLPTIEISNIILLKIQKQINQMLLSMQELYNVGDLDIPVIIYTGSFDVLSDIFEKMNSNGTQLSKYEIYAAKWSTTTFILEDALLLGIIDKKYEDMIENTGVEILDYENGQITKNQRINLFEYCFSLGKLLKQECNYILGTKFGNSSDVDSLGFVLLSTILTNSAKRISSLPKFFDNVSSNELIKLKSKILECAREVAKTLNGYIITLDEKYVSKYIESQMITIIATLFKIKYTKIDDKISFTNNTDNKQLLQKFKRVMPKRYLYDVISNYWIGNGDKKITDEIGKSLDDNRYLTPILSDSWYLLLDDWTSEQTKKPMKNMQKETKLLINYIIHLSVPTAKYQSKKFNFEYIISKDRLSKNIKNCMGISALGNIALLPQFEVKSKQEKTIYEQIDDRSIIYDINEEILDDFLYPERNELSFVKTNETFTLDEFLSFVKNRNKYLIKKFVELIGE